MNLRPLHDSIVACCLAEGEQEIRSIIIPDTAKEKPLQGTVIAARTGKTKDRHHRRQTTKKLAAIKRQDHKEEEVIALTGQR